MDPCFLVKVLNRSQSPGCQRLLEPAVVDQQLLNVQA